MKKHTITFHHEAKITANGKNRNGNKKPIIAIDLYETFNSCEDFMETYHVCHCSLYRALHPDDGKEIWIKVFRLDENGKKICIGKTRVSYVAHSETVVGKLVDNGKEMDEKLNREKAYNEHLRNENTKLKNENAALKHENNELQNAKSSYQDTVESLVMEIKHRKILRERALEEARQLETLIAESEEKLHRMIWGDNDA